MLDNYAAQIIKSDLDRGFDVYSWVIKTCQPIKICIRRVDATARDQLNPIRSDLVLLDLMMPERNRFGLIETLQQID